MNRSNTLVRGLPEGCLWVSQVTDIIKWTLERNISDAVVAGEISNLTVSTLGHHYFTLRDEGSQLRAVMFKGNALGLHFTPRNGMQVAAWGRITVYEKQGNYQLQVSALRPLGRGDLFERFQQLKEKLEKEGLFDKARKRQIPFFPRRVGIITSPYGAAVRDMCSIARRRNAAVSLVFVPAQVQGDEAPLSLIRALERAQALSLDILI
ncbi:MAG: exodeoxyribonuclease VII large subunit, partial [Armatimonadetes bacterium]|nr:exodeoxyribonuclease VII large subunit [Armatimonadota bacterium]